ncbi:MAG: N,N'-diacetylchitobiose phosphorylase, partial [Oscillospiraceae bacterium]
MRYGHFDNAQREYVLDRVDVPVSWTNYLGVEDLCAVVNHTAGGYLFYKTPEYHRITRFRPNGAPMDRPGHYVYLRDDDTGEYWSVSWQPCGGDLADYRCRFGLSYAVYECNHSGIAAAQTLLIPRGDDVELWDVSLQNTTKKERHISVFSYAEFSFHQIPMDNQNFQMSLYAAGSDFADGIIDYELFYEGAHQYMACTRTPDGFDCLRDTFLGDYRTETNPLAVENGKCFGSFEKGGNHCAVLHKKLTIPAGSTERLTFLLGEGNRSDGAKMREKYARSGAVDAAMADLAAFWDKKLSKLQVSTPSKDMDTMLNIWNLYQSEINVMFSRFASFIEV